MNRNKEVTNVGEEQQRLIINKINDLSRILLVKQNDYIKRLTENNVGIYKNLSFVITPNIVTFYNYMHDVMYSSIKNLPIDLCTENGGYACSNVKFLKTLPISRTEVGGGNDGRAKSVVNRNNYDAADGDDNDEDLNSYRIKNLYNVEISRNARLDDGNNEILKSAIEILDSINISVEYSNVDIRNEFIDNISTIGNIFNSKLKEFENSLRVLNRDLINVRKELKLCKANKDSASEGEDYLSEIERLKRENKTLVNKYNSCTVYNNTLQNESAKDVELLNTLTTTLNGIREELFKNYDFKLKSLNDILEKLIIQANDSNEILKTRINDKPQIPEYMDTSEGGGFIVQNSDDDKFESDKTYSKHIPLKEIVKLIPISKSSGDEIKNLKLIIIRLKERLKLCIEDNDRYKSMAATTASDGGAGDGNKNQTFYNTRLKDANDKISEVLKENEFLKTEINILKDKYEKVYDAIDDLVDKEKRQIVQKYEEQFPDVIDKTVDNFQLHSFDKTDLSYYTFDNSLEMSLFAKIYLFQQYIIYINNNINSIFNYLKISKNIVLNKNQEVEYYKNVLKQNNVLYREMVKSDILMDRDNTDNSVIVNLDIDGVESKLVNAVKNLTNAIGAISLQTIRNNPEEYRRCVEPVIVSIMDTYKERFAEEYNLIQQLKPSNDATLDSLKQEIFKLKAENSNQAKDILVLKKYEDVFKFIFISDGSDKPQNMNVIMGYLNNNLKESYATIEQLKADIQNLQEENAQLAQNMFTEM